MWEIEVTDEYERRLKRWQKDNECEVRAVLANLARYLESLNQGVKPPQIQFGFLHSERMGVVAIDQKGGKGKGRLIQTRLYVYPDTDTETLYLLTLGGKDRQGEDIQLCHKFVDDLRQDKEQAANEQAEGQIEG